MTVTRARKQRSRCTSLLNSSLISSSPPSCSVARFRLLLFIIYLGRSTTSCVHTEGVAALRVPSQQALWECSRTWF